MTPSGRGSSRNRKKVKRRRQQQRHLRVAPESGPIIVHAPQDYAEVAFGSFITVCTGRRVEVDTPPNMVVRDDGESGVYLAVGPHPRYYEKCPGCFPEVAW